MPGMPVSPAAAAAAASGLGSPAATAGGGKGGLDRVRPPGDFTLGKLFVGEAAATVIGCADADANDEITCGGVKPGDDPICRTKYFK